jgi:hypothetical protein
MTVWGAVVGARRDFRYKSRHLLDDAADGLPGHFRRKTVPRLFYFLANSGAVFFLPFLGPRARRSAARPALPGGRRGAALRSAALTPPRRCPQEFTGEGTRATPLRR